MFFETSGAIGILKIEKETAMSFTEFMFSRQMQIILFFISCLATFVHYCWVTNIILKIYAEKVSQKRQMAFVLIYGVFLNNIVVYLIYLMGNMVSFSPLVYSLVTVANPAYAMLLYLCGIKILQLSPYRSVHIMSNAYIYFVAVNRINQFIGFTFFTQNSAQYNYMSDALSLVCSTVVNYLLYMITMALTDRFNFIIKQADQLHIESLWREVLRSFLKACFVFGMVVLLPRYVSGSLVYLVLSFIFALMIAISFLSDARKVAEIDVGNKETYINNLVETIDQFRGIKHDINNMLMIYEGYITLGDLDKLREYHSSLLNITSQSNYRMYLAQKINDNPAFIALLNAKLDYAESSSVNLDVDITCNLDFGISDIDICRAVGSLLDNAIEAAATSTQRKVLFSIEKQPNNTKLIVIKNSTPDIVEVNKLTQGVTTKAGHAGMGLAQVRRTLGKYGNCSFNFTYYDHSFTAYIAIMSD